MKRRLTGKVAIVTGASSGIGEATARRLAEEGARVVLAARREERLEALRGRIGATGGEALAVPTDVALAAERERLVGETLSAYGRIDALVNNAGYGQRGPLELVPLEAVRRNFETNVFGLLALTQLVIPVMRGQGSGRIVNVSSVAGRIVWPYSAVYGATKHALEALSDGLRVELEPFGIQVVVIEPGFVRTEFAEAAALASRSVTEVAGPYGAGVEGAGRRLQRGLRIAAQPEEIAEKIADALAVRRPRPRYAAPLHARVALLARRVLPQRLLDRVLTAGRG
ncbi:MAG TPA: SDR family NAD(P)-dependent oxidoreductase [Gemmatimonadota bacterium]